jgi:hypothetical protein
MSDSTLHITATSETRDGVSSSGTATNVWVFALWALFLLTFGALAAALGSALAIAYTLGTVLLFALPGVLLMPLFGAEEMGVQLEKTITGAAVGMGISGYTALCVGFRYGWSPKAIAFVIVALSAVCGATGQIFKGRVHWPAREWSAKDYGILAAMWTTVVAFTAIPALEVGKLTERGYAFTWLYGLDFLARCDFAVAMTTKMPPDLLWMTGTPLRMYLVGYTIPAFAFAASAKTISIHAVMILATLCLSLVLTGCLYIFLRTLFKDFRVLASCAFVVLTAYSYYWVYDAVKAPFIRPGHRFEFHDSVSHLLQRSFLVEPQALVCTAMLLILLATMIRTQYRLNSYALGIFCGVCLGVSFGAEAVQGMLIVGWFGLFYLGRLILGKGSWREELGPLATAVVTCGAICGSYYLLGMYARSTSHLLWFSFNTWLMKYGLGYFPIEFGPLLILGIWGVTRWWKGSRGEFGWAVLLLGAMAMVPVLFIKTVAPQETRMADRLLPIVFLTFTGYLLQQLWAEDTTRRVRLVVAGIVLAAVPTFFTDIYYTSNVSDLYNTHYVSVADQQACDWIRKNLPETAVIQGDNNYYVGSDRGLYISLMSSFGQRPQVLGWYTGAATLVDDGWRLAEQRREDVYSAMRATDVASLEQFLQKYSVDYLYVGPFEQARYAQLLPLLHGAPGDFRSVYAANGVEIFQVVGGR